ncbi:MAG: sugar ABC transporter ATP-binding protein [Labedaea sp.]
MPAADVPVVEAIGVSKRFGSTVALDDASISVTPGEAHALVGRNGAGKSTLVSVLTGLHAPEAGTVVFAGELAPRLSDRDGWRRRVACVYQRSTVIPELTVAENLFLNRYQRGPSGLISWPRLRREAARLLAEWSVDVDPRQPARDLGVEDRQFVEIARALSFGARFIILDEPTAQLDAAAIDRLFEKMRGLRQQGVTFLFISHHLQEIYEICDTVTVYRDARHVLTAPVADVSRTDLVTAMTGEANPGAAAGLAGGRIGGSVCTVAGLSCSDLYTDVDFEVSAGEIVGLAGSGGSGKTELAETIAGLRRADTGTIAVAGRPLRPGDVPAALASGIGFVPRDRHRQGLIGGMSVADNVTLTIPRRLGSAGFVSGARRDGITRTMIDDLAIKTPGPDQPVTNLSGGNQQKVVLARALANDPRLLVLITPTAGIDVRSKEFLLGKIAEIADRGTGVVIASDELDDLRGCDRVLVLFQGRIVAAFSRGWADNELVAAMEGVDVHA